MEIFVYPKTTHAGDRPHFCGIYGGSLIVDKAQGQKPIISSDILGAAGFPASEPVRKEDSLKGQIQFGGSWYGNESLNAKILLRFGAADLVLLPSGYYKGTVTESTAAIQQNLVNLTITVPEDRVYVETVTWKFSGLKIFSISEVLKKALTRVASSLYELTDSASGYFQLWE